MNNLPEQEIKKLYRRYIWVWIFAHIRFWTGSYKEIEAFIPRVGNIVDFGCGYGIFANYLGICSPKRKIIGVDTDDKKIKKAYHGLKNVSLKIGDATTMNLKKIRAVILHDVIHHLSSHRKQEIIIENCFNMLEANGELLIVEIDNYSVWKLISTRLTDFFMYKGGKVLYRYQSDLLQLLSRFFPRKNIEIIRLHNNPFPQQLYICRK